LFYRLTVRRGFSAIAASSNPPINQTPVIIYVLFLAPSAALVISGVIH